MIAPRHPRPNDVVIHHEDYKAPSKYTVAFAAQSEVQCPSFADALDRAGRFAASHHVDVWYEDEAQHVVLPLDGEWLGRILAEYDEQPGLSLTRAQAQRLWGLDERTCVTMLDTLAAVNLLVVGRDGRYRRPSPETRLAHVRTRPLQAARRDATHRKSS